MALRPPLASLGTQGNTEHYLITYAVDEISVIIEDVLHEVNERCKLNCLTIHPDKTEVLIISRGPIIGPQKSIKLKDHIVRYVSESECLGMTVDNRLRWNSHTKKASSNLSTKVKQLKGMRSLPADILETICFRGILPSVTYGLGIWGSCSTSLLEELENMYRRSARIIHKIPKQVQKRPIT